MGQSSSAAETITTTRYVCDEPVVIYRDGTLRFVSADKDAADTLDRGFLSVREHVKMFGDDPLDQWRYIIYTRPEFTVSEARRAEDPGYVLAKDETEDDRKAGDGVKYVVRHSCTLRLVNPNMNQQVAHDISPDVFKALHASDPKKFTRL
ncbi:MAG: hypothetical protein KGL39_09415 [Patescibacteria group bacterium]|nr:hypothetical protein [Patescibacteria group bacterium]